MYSIRLGLGRLAPLLVIVLLLLAPKARANLYEEGEPAFIRHLVILEALEIDEGCGYYYSYIPWDLDGPSDWVVGYDGWGWDWYFAYYHGWITYSVYDELLEFTGSVAGSASLNPPGASSGRSDLGPGERVILRISPAPNPGRVSSISYSNMTEINFNAGAGTLEVAAWENSGAAYTNIGFADGTSSNHNYQVRPPTAVALAKIGDMTIAGIIAGGFNATVYITSSYNVHYGWLYMHEGPSPLDTDAGGYGALSSVAAPHPDYSSTPTAMSADFGAGGQKLSNPDLCRGNTGYRLGTTGPGTQWTANGGNPAGKGWWTIDWYWRLGSGGIPKEFVSDVVQTFQVYSSGNLSVSKSAASSLSVYPESSTIW